MASTRSESDSFLRGVEGVYRNIPEGVYHGKDDAISNSGLGRIKRSPAHFKFGGGSGSSDALMFGRAFHSALLTPHEFEMNYVTFDGDRRTTAGKEAYAKMIQLHGDSVMKAGDMETILAMRLAGYMNPVAKGLLEAKGECELSILWNCEGVLAKSRIDKYLEADGILMDLKTTRNAHPEAFSKSIYQYGYHRQAAFYLYAARVMGLVAHRFIFVAMEKEPPYGVAVYELTQEALAAGLTEALDLIATYRTCLETNTWPSYGSDIISVDLPSWAYSEASSQDDQP